MQPAAIIPFITGGLSGEEGLMKAFPILQDAFEKHSQPISEPRDMPKRSACAVQFAADVRVLDACGFRRTMADLMPDRCLSNDELDDWFTAADVSCMGYIDFDSFMQLIMLGYSSIKSSNGAKDQVDDAAKISASGVLEDFPHIHCVKTRESLGHASLISRLLYISSHDCICTVGQDGELHWWQSHSFQHVRSFSVPILSPAITAGIQSMRGPRIKQHIQTWITDATVIGDGPLIACVSLDRALRLIDLTRASGSEVTCVAPSFRHPLCCIAWCTHDDGSADSGEYLVLGDMDGSVFERRFDSGELAAFACGRTGIPVLSWMSFNKLSTLHKGSISRVIWVAERGSFCSACSGGRVVLRRPSHSRSNWSLNCSEHHQGGINDIAWCARDELVATAGRESYVYLWAIFTDAPSAMLSVSGSVQHVCALGTSSLMAVTRRNQVVVWEVSTGVTKQVIPTLPRQRPENNISSCLWRPEKGSGRRGGSLLLASAFLNVFRSAAASNSGANSKEGSELSICVFKDGMGVCFNSSRAYLLLRLLCNGCVIRHGVVSAAAALQVAGSSHVHSRLEDSPVTAAALCGDGRRLVVAFACGVIGVWAGASGLCVAGYSLPLHNDEVVTITESYGSGKLFIIAGTRGGSIHTLTVYPSVGGTVAQSEHQATMVASDSSVVFVGTRESSSSAMMPTCTIATADGHVSVMQHPSDIQRSLKLGGDDCSVKCVCFLKQQKLLLGGESGSMPWLSTFSVSGAHANQLAEKKLSKDELEIGAGIVHLSVDDTESFAVALCSGGYAHLVDIAGADMGSLMVVICSWRAHRVDALGCGWFGKDSRSFITAGSDGLKCWRLSAEGDVYYDQFVSAGGSINCFSKPRLAAPPPVAAKLTPQLTLEDEFESQSSDEESLDLLAICKGGYREEERRQRVRDQRFASLLKQRKDRKNHILLPLLSSLPVFAPSPTPDPGRYSSQRVKGGERLPAVRAVLPRNGGRQRSVRGNSEKLSLSASIERCFTSMSSSTKGWGNRQLEKAHKQRHGTSLAHGIQRRGLGNLQSHSNSATAGELPPRSVSSML